jgi:hypothetical protein
MPKTLSKNDPNLLAGVRRLQRAEQVWGALLIGLGLLTELAATSEHPVAGLPFIAIGLFALRWAEPALLATVAALMAFSIVPTINPRVTILGPDPVTKLAALSFIELAALVVGKALITLTAANQFFLYRFLYGTERASSDDPELAIIPPMVPNRTDGLARGARWFGLIGAALSAAGLLVLFAGSAAYQARILAEMGGSVATAAIGLGLGTAFAPTNERQAALAAVVLGLGAYVAAATVLLRLPG